VLVRYHSLYVASYVTVYGVLFVTNVMI